MRTPAEEIANIYLEARKEKLTESKAFLRVKPFLEDRYQQEGLSSLSKEVLKTTNLCCVKAKDAEAFGKGFFKIIAGEGDTLGDDEALLFEKLVERFPNSAKLAEMLADVYGVIANETGDEIYIQKLDDLSKNNPALENAALQRLYALVDIYYNKDFNLNDYIKAIEKAKEIYQQHPKSDFAEYYARGLSRIVQEQEEEEDALKTIELLKELLHCWNDSFIAAHYLDALSKLSWKQDEKGCLETIQKMESYWNNWPYKKGTLAMHLAYTLANYSLCTKGTEREKVLDKIEKLAAYWEPAAELAYELAEGTYRYAHKPAKAQ